MGQWLDSPNVSGYVFVGPFIIGFLAFMMVPMLLSFAFSFTRYNILQSPTFIGLENYITMFTDDPKFWKVFGVTMYYVVFSVPLRLIMALIVAMLLVKSTKLSGFYRAVYYLPSIIGSSVAVAILWKRMFASDGVINGLAGTFRYCDLDPDHFGSMAVRILHADLPVRIKADSRKLI